MNTVSDVILKKSFERLSGGPYVFEEVFRPAEYDWPGDWEGRALLAFASHAKISGKVIPCMEKMMDAMPGKMNCDGYFGKLYTSEAVDEQQLSGHNWVLRGLMAYDEFKGGNRGITMAKKIIDNLFVPAWSCLDRYPVCSRELTGGVSGNSLNIVNGWKLSSDVGCAFMALDAVPEYYAKTGDEKLRPLIDKAIEIYSGIDFVGLKVQTHATLSACRGVIKMYEYTKEQKYLDIALRIYSLYLEKGMTLTYENFNWFDRFDTWTEPCAVVDSFILACKLYEITGDKKYFTLIRRIWFNGLRFCFRENGGAGPNTCVTEEQPILQVSAYEAPFCCTMRYCEGLVYVTKNAKYLDWDETKPEEVDGYGRHFVDDMLIVRVNGRKMPIPDSTDLPEENAGNFKAEVVY